MKKIILKFISSIIQGVGISIGVGICILTIILLLGIDLSSYIPTHRLHSLFNDNNKVSTNVNTLLYKPKPKLENVLLKHINANFQITVPISYTQYFVTSSEEFYKTLKIINASSGNAAITFDDGIYHLTRKVLILKPNIMFLSKSMDPSKVILKGNGMAKGNDTLIEVYAAGFVLDGITLKESGNHLIHIKAEKNASFPIIRNCILQDSYQQLLKVSYDKRNNPNNYAHSGLIEHCLFEYTAKIGPNYYIGGIDAHGIKNWIIRKNIFKNIASPEKSIAEYAIHLWNNTENNIVDSNVIIDSDRGIGFGMSINMNKNKNKNIKFSNYGGVIRNNVIYHSDNNHPFADTGIAIENSPKTIIEDNFIFLEHNYSRAIEYRFISTQQVLIKNNQTNKNISSRNGGQAKLINNNENLDKVDFIIRMNQLISNMSLK